MDPAIFLVTHWKAGSQWINRILTACAPDLIVPPQGGEGQFLYWPLQAGKVYPTVYVTAQQFASVKLPAAWRRFVVIRDLRDTLISAYFSLKVSHAKALDNAPLRNRLQMLDFEAGITLLMDEWLPACARIQLSWQEAGERLIRYEDLLEHDQEILEPLLLKECELPIEPSRLAEIIQANRFERLTEGRPRGQEDIRAHERKGIAGDWRNYFSAEVTRRFKSRFGGVLCATGYEQDSQW
jgi:lipopolysaccharide transport system ATP-binding protein